MFNDPESRKKCRYGADLLVMVGGVVCNCVMLKTLLIAAYSNWPFELMNLLLRWEDAVQVFS